MLKKLFLITSFCFFTFFGGLSPVYAQSAVAPSANLDDAGYTFDVGSITHPGIISSTRRAWQEEGINYVLGRVIQILAGVIGSLSVLMMSFGGFLILSSAGSENQYGKGMNYIKYSLIGLACSLFAYMLVVGVQLIIKNLYN